MCVCVLSTHNGGALDGEMRQRPRGGGRDGRERRAHDAEEEAEVGAAERPVAGAGGHQRGAGQVAADPLPEPVPPPGLLAGRVVLGHLRALHERRQGLPARAEAAGVGDELVRRVRG